jgi:hypothetical protein
VYSITAFRKEPTGWNRIILVLHELFMRSLHLEKGSSVSRLEREGGLLVGAQ